MVTQSFAQTCTFTLSPNAYGYSSQSATGTITVTSSSSDCAWTVTNNASWITITSGGSGTGNGSISYTVAANTTASGRTTTIVIGDSQGGQVLTIRQAASTFADVPDNQFTSYIYAIYTEGVTVGCGDGYYCPSTQVTRGQMAAFIIRSIYGESFSYTTTPYFSDVPSDHTFFKYVQKMKDAGITAVSGTYMVDDLVPREQMAAFIIRAKYGEAFDYTQTPYFTDVPSMSIFFKYIQKMKDDGITAVTDTYMPSTTVTRDQMAAFLARAFLGMPILCCDFDSGGDSVERCFGGVGSKCHGVPLARMDRDNSCMVTGFMSAGSILHDKCCKSNNNVGVCCNNGLLSQLECWVNLLVPSNGPCSGEWNEALDDYKCTILYGAPRQVSFTWGPYKCGNEGDNTNAPVYLPPCTRVNKNYQYDISYLCEFGYEFDTNDNPRISADNCDDYYVCTDEYSNIAGVWHYSDTGTITCTYDGESETEDVSGSGTATINQNNNTVSWVVPGTNYSRSGTVSRNRIQDVYGVFVVPLVSGVNISENSYTAKGTFSCTDNKIELRGSGIATGTFCDEDGCYSFSCTGTDTAVFTRSTSESTSQIIIQKTFNETSPRLFLKNSLQVFTTISPAGQ